MLGRGSTGRAGVNMVDSNGGHDSGAKEEQRSDGSVAVKSTYKVLGALEDGEAAGVLGRNDADGGTPIGVQGAVPNTDDGYGLATPDALRLLGILDTDGTTFRVDTTVESDPEDAANVVVGYEENVVENDAVGATISGGGREWGGPNAGWNRVFDDYGTVSGGFGNQAGGGYQAEPGPAPAATVGGGRLNTASGTKSTVGGGAYNDAEGPLSTVGGGDGNSARGEAATIAGGYDNATSEVDSATVGGGRDNRSGSDFATVGGGQHNRAAGTHATVPGGKRNRTSGAASLAAGSYAQAEDDNAFVWNDGSGADTAEPEDDADRFSSSTADGSGVTGSQTFHVKATGGARFVTDAENNAVTYLSGGSGGWSTTSTRTAKTNVEPVDPETMLEGVDSMEVSTWEYRDGDGDGAGVTHVGPMAEQFHEAFDVGDSEETINSINADGVAFGAIKGLSASVDETDERVDRQADRLDRLEAENEALRTELQERDDRIDDLEARLASVEQRLDAGVSD
ncbi:hypothetical protein BRC64_11425 [Halobacteriales archaeon QH_10_67_22]|nr:MAG: hypothetical protein BRC64_11425 [Halobacteriales archaeon QH_10_67_22]